MSSKQRASIRVLVSGVFGLSLLLILTAVVTSASEPATSPPIPLRVPPLLQSAAVRKPMVERSAEASPTASVSATTTAQGSFYTLTVVAQTGASNLTSIDPYVSVNSQGDVAFTGHDVAGQGIFTVRGSQPAINISPRLSDSGTYRLDHFVQINDKSEVVASDTIVGYSTSRVRAWDANGTDALRTIATGSTSPDVNAPFDSVSARTINNLGQAAFLAARRGHDYLVTGSTPPFDGRLEMPAGSRPMISDDGAVVLREGPDASFPVRLYDAHLTTSMDVATASMGFSEFGRSPGISDDGQAVAFFAELDAANAVALGTVPGPGIFVSVPDVEGRRIVRLAGGHWDSANQRCQEPELGSDASVQPICFREFVRDSRVGVVHVGTPGPSSADAILLTFLATSSNSFDAALWVVRLDRVGSKYSLAAFTRIIGVGDMLRGAVVRGLALYDPISLDDSVDPSAAPGAQPLNHYLAFLAQTDAGSQVVRANSLSGELHLSAPFALPGQHVYAFAVLSNIVRQELVACHGSIDG